MKKLSIRMIKFLTFSLLLLAVQFSNISAQNTGGFADVKKLYDDKKFTAVLNAIDPLIDQYSSDKELAESLANLYFMRGSSRFNAIYQVRTGVIFGSDKVFEETRPRFEIEITDKFIKLLNGATADLKQAWEMRTMLLIAKKGDSGYAYRFRDAELEGKEIEALTYLEKAQLVTNSKADFSAARLVFSEIDSIHDANISAYGGKFGEDNTRVKKGDMLAAEIRTKVALGEIEAAALLFAKWQKANGYSVLKKEIAVPSMVEAFDLVGNYKHTEAFLIREAVRQITLDKGKVIPANFTILKAAMKSHLYNMNFAANIPLTNKFLPFQRARLASAYNIKGNLTPAESAFLKNAPDVIKAGKETPPLDTQLNSVILKLQSTDKKESDAAKKTIDELIKKDATNVAILAVRGYSKMLNNDFAGAETDLSAAIKKDPFLAFANKAFENRALVYNKLGKADLAAKDEKENAQFKQLLALLASA